MCDGTGASFTDVSDISAAVTIEVVIPAHNAAAFLRETLASVAGQTRKPAMVSVVDDASTDDTRAIAEAARTALSGEIRIRVLRNEGPRGPAAARNTAIRTSGADMIALLDADDLMLPGHLATLGAALDGVPEAVLSFGDTEIFAAGTTLVPSLLHESGVAGLPAAEAPPGFWQVQGGMFVPLLRTGVFGTSACLFRRAIAIETGLFDETMVYGEDTDLFLRLALAGPFLFSRDVVSRKRTHDGNMSQERNRLAFCRGKVWSLMKLTAPESGLEPGQRATLERELTRGVQSYLYYASRSGAGAYRRAAALVRQAGFGRLALHPRHLLRLAASTLR